MTNQLTIIVDADAIIAQALVDDLHHETAVKIAEKLVASQARVIYPVTAVTEAMTFMQRVLNNSAAAHATAQLMAGNDAQVAEVTKQTLARALSYFSPSASKKHTIFDCIICAVAEEYKADAIFSFDKFYRKNDFVLASDL